MPKPRTPLGKALASGATVIHPERFKDRRAPKRTRPLGDPFSKMTTEQREAWEEFRAELPWLNSSHRALLQIACVFRARLEADPDIGVSQLQTYSSVLSKLGATPVDETKIGGGADEGDEDPADQYFN